MGDEIPQKRLNFDKDTLEASRQAKGIHLALEQGIKNVCEEAEGRFSQTRVENRDAYLNDSKNWRRIVLNQGYVILPGELLRLIGSTVAMTAVSGDHRTLKCPAVTFEILTNSVATTDLSPINLFANVQLSSLLETQRESEDYYYSVAKSSVGDPKLKKFFPPAKIKYYELQAPPEESQKNGISVESLHTKVYVLGDRNIIVGSANADVRSYYMDTNNAVLIKNVPNFISRYLEWVDSQKQFSSTSPFFAFGNDEMIKIAHAVSNLSENQRKETFKSIYNGILSRMAQAYEAKWIKEASGVKTPEIQKKIALIEKYLPLFVNIVTDINLQMYNLSQTIINDELNILGKEMQKRMHQLNLGFEVL